MSNQPKKPVPRPTPFPPEDVVRNEGTRLFRLINPELYAVRLWLDPPTKCIAHLAVIMRGNICCSAAPILAAEVHVSARSGNAPSREPKQMPMPQHYV